MDTIERRTGHCACGGIIYREGNYILCTNCDRRCISKREADDILPSKEELEHMEFIKKAEEFNGGS